jgi:outer membrane immunogenic protein
MGLIMKTKILVTAAVMTFAAIGFANAADLPMPAPVYKAPPPPVYNWTGCYIAGGGGYGIWSQDGVVNNIAGVPVSTTNTNGGKGWFGMGQAGCDYEFSLPLFAGWSPNLVIGVFGDYDAGSLRGTSSTISLVGIGMQSGPENNSSSWFVGGRAGYVVNPRFLTYIDGGYTQARFDQVNYTSALIIPGFAGPTGFSLAAQTYNGWFLGSGFEYSFDWLPIPGLFLKTEYRYSQYNSTNVPFVLTATGALVGTPGAPVTLTSQKNIQMVSTELVWRFNFLGGHY